jgi:uncharacterized protein (DUF305 family)
MRTRRSIAAAVVPLALLAAACGDDGGDDESAETQDEPTTSDAASEEHNDADVAFAQMMIPHHGQAVEMAVLAADRAASPEIRDLAQRIQGAQDPEIQQMTGWLQEWGEEVPAPDAGHDMGGTDMGGTDMGGSTAPGDTAPGDTAPGDTAPTGGAAGPMAEGMMDDAAMMELEAATGPAFDRLFAELMIEHHQGAVAMANDEIANGQFADAIALAEAIVEAQEAEIAEMEAFLAQAP